MAFSERQELASKYGNMTLEEPFKIEVKEEEEEEEFELDFEEEEEENPLDELVPPINWAEAPWPPMWKENIEESPQYLWGMIDRFVKPWKLEALPPMEDSQFNVPPRPRYLTGRPSRNYHRTIKTFLEQVRKSRGYDLDVNAPWFVHSSFLVRTRFMHLAAYSSSLTTAIKFAIAEINKNAQPHGKCYELVKVEKYVDAPNHRTMLITFTVKDVASPDNVEETIQAMVFVDAGPKYRLVEWRFKPDDE